MELFDSIMVWPFSSNKKSVEEQKTVDESIDPSLKEFYDSAKPLTPVSLAPEKVKEEYKSNLEATKRARNEVPNYKEEGMAQIDSHGELETDPVTGKNLLPLGQAARNNCVEYEALMANCSLKGTYWEKLNMCHMYRKQQMRCVELQTEALKVLGYNRAITRDQQIEVQNKADDIFSTTVPDGPITDNIAEKFEKAVDKERVESSQLIYRV